MGSTTQDTGYYVWSVSGKPITVHLNLEVVDRMASEVMRGFGAVPKRGAEVGGLLIGTIEPADPTIVRIEDFEPIDCSYMRGPSYLLNGTDHDAFVAACERWEQNASPHSYAVGYFRSHTRDGLALAPDDVDMMDRFFPVPSQVALLIKPFATKVSRAGFFFREAGDFQPETPLEFPFRRRELGGEEAPPRRSLTDRRPRSRDLTAMPAAAADHSPEDEAFGDFESFQPPDRSRATAVSSRPDARKGWMWIPVSFVFLLLGVLLGFQAALTMGPKAKVGTDFSLDLSVNRSADNLNVKWNPQAAVLRTAQHGSIEIHDGAQSMSRDLDSAQLQNGSMIYHNSSNEVRFRLTVFPDDRVSVTETINWKR